MDEMGLDNSQQIRQRDGLGHEPLELNVYPYYDRANRISRQRRRPTSLLLRVLPRHTFTPLFFELRVALVRFRSRKTPRKYSNAKGLLVNLGAGDKGKPGWVNLDVFREATVNCIWDCRKRLPFPDGTVKAIFTEHFFEHVDYTEEVPYFLTECHRVLEPGGVIRIIVPDAEKYLRAYCAGDWESIDSIRPLTSDHEDTWTRDKYRTRMELINNVFRQGAEHKYAYDFETLQFLLERYGFSDIRKQRYGQSMLPELCIDTAARATESLYVEAVKGAHE